MTTEIKLPPLPELGEYITIWERILEWDNEPKAGTRALALSDKVDDEITATLQAYATAAIKAYRAQRGEPVGEVVDMKYGKVKFYGGPNGVRPQGYLQPGVPLYTAPQPERKHTEAEVQALLDAGEKLATMRYSDGEFEQYVRRILGVPKP